VSESGSAVVLDPAAVRKALSFFKVMATTAGVALFVLVVVVFIHYGLHNARPSETWSPIHGVIFMVYVYSVANLGFKARWGIGRMVRIMLAGVVPLLPFFVERSVAAEVEQQLAEA
jgi:integral membrane protein